MFAYAYLARLAAGQGRAEHVQSSADRVAALSEDLPQQPLPLAIALLARAESCLWSGEVEQSLGYAERAEAIATYRLVRADAIAIRVRALADVAERARRRGQAVAESSTKDEQDAKEALGDGHPQVRAFAATVLAELSRRAGRRDPAPWRDAVEAWDAAGDPYRAAYCRWRVGYALLATRSGRPEAARELQSAHVVAIRMEAQPLRAAIERLALAARIQLGAGVARGETAMAVVASELGITHRELEILPLLAAGRTNQEIAQLLVISPRTVGVHVSRILQKLGATRRTEAADIARRRGLVG
jgi:DNA-binding CsgD family transcriptional regulator